MYTMHIEPLHFLLAPLSPHSLLLPLSTTHSQQKWHVIITNTFVMWVAELCKHHSHILQISSSQLFWSVLRAAWHVIV